MKRVLLLVLVSVISAVSATAQTGSADSGKPFVVEYYYKAKWGHAEEFLTLFKKNHYPLLKKQVEMGRMVKVGWTSRGTTQRKTGAGIIA